MYTQPFICDMHTRTRTVLNELSADAWLSHVLPLLTHDQLLIFSVFSRQTRPSSSGIAPDQTMKLVHQSTIPDNQITTQIRSGPDHQIRPWDPTSTANPDHQFRSPHQTTGQHSWLLSFQSAQHTQALEMVQVRCILYGLGQGGYIELWMNLAKHTFHTRSA